MLYFRNERRHGTGNLKGIFPGHLQPPLDKNSEVPVILISEFVDVTMNHLFLGKIKRKSGFTVLNNKRCGC